MLHGLHGQRDGGRQPARPLSVSEPKVESEDGDNDDDDDWDEDDYDEDDDDDADDDNSERVSTSPLPLSSVIKSPMTVKFAMYTQCCVAYGHTAGASRSEKRLFLGNLQNWRQISYVHTMLKERTFSHEQ